MSPNRNLLPALVLLGLVAHSLAQTPMLTARQGRSALVLARDVTTNGVAALTNGPGKLMVAAVAPTSVRGGSVSLVNRELWVARYNGSSHNDSPYALAADAEGNIVAAGPSFFAPFRDYVTVKYAPNGAPLWTRRYHAAGRDSYARHLAVDGDGSIYVTGDSAADDFYNVQIVTIKYSADGAALWTNTHGGAGLRFGSPSKLSVDQQGNAYLVFADTISSNRVAFGTIKYNADGTAAWTNRFNLSSTSDDFPADGGLDAAGNLFVTGLTSDATLPDGMTTVKYSPNGQALWTNRYTGPIAGVLTRTLHVDRQDNVFASAETEGGPMGYVGYVTVKYANDGTALWTNQLAGPNYSGGAVPQLRTDPLGHLYIVTGWPGANTRDVNMSTVKISPGGAVLWTNHLFEPTTARGDITDSAVDSAGNIFLTGYSPETETTSKYLTVKINPDGVTMWTNRYDGPREGHDWSMGVLATAEGSVIVTGKSPGILTGDDFATIKYADYIHYVPAAGFVGADSFSCTIVDVAGNTVDAMVHVTVLPPIEFNSVVRGQSSVEWEVRNLDTNGPLTISASPNLIDWETVLTLRPGSSTLPFTDNAAANFTRRFYRAAQPQ